LRQHLIIASHIVKISMIIDANKGWKAIIEAYLTFLCA